MATVTADAQEVHLAQTQKIPGWNGRLQAALGVPPSAQAIHFTIDFNQLTTGIAEPEMKLKVIKAAVSTTDKLGGLQQVPAAAAVVTAAFEASMTDPAVKQDVASKVRAVALVNQPVGTLPANKALSFDEGSGVITYAGVFSDGKGVFTKTEIIAFIETKFYAQERGLVTSFLHQTLPQAQQRLAALVPGLRLTADIMAILQHASSQDKRLPTAKTLVNKRTTADEIKNVAGKMEHELQKVGADIEKELTGETQVQVGSAPKVTDDSPSVLKPLLEAVEQTIKASQNNAVTIAGAVAEIVVTTAPGATATAAAKTLALVDPAGNVIEPSALPVPPVTPGSKIMYTGAFEAGTSGCFTKGEIVAFLELHFRCQERGLVENLLSQHMPLFNQRVQQVCTPAVQIEINWNGIFIDTVKPGEERLDMANLLCKGGSTNVIAPFVKAMEEIVSSAGAAGPANPVQQILMKRVNHIIVQGVPSTAPPKSKPSVTMQPSATGVGETLVYSVAFALDTRGCLSTQEAKDALRLLFGIAKPDSEKGIAAAAGKAGVELGRIGADIGKKFGKMSFGFGKK